MTTLVPAYGRDYTSAKQVKEDWANDKDFIIQSFGHRYDGKPMNKQDATKGEQYQIRFKRLAKFTIVKG